MRLPKGSTQYYSLVSGVHSDGDAMAIRIFVTRHFDRYARKQSITDQLLIDAIMRAEQGLVDANLGGFLIKQRIARAGQGRSSGYRTIIAYRKGDLAVFLSIFKKSQKANISQDDLVAFQDMADLFSHMTPNDIRQFVTDGKWRPLHVFH